MSVEGGTALVWPACALDLQACLIGFHVMYPNPPRDYERKHKMEDLEKFCDIVVRRSSWTRFKAPHGLLVWEEVLIFWLLCHCWAAGDCGCLESLSGLRKFYSVSVDSGNSFDGFEHLVILQWHLINTAKALWVSVEQKCLSVYSKRLEWMS